MTKKSGKNNGQSKIYRIPGLQRGYLPRKAPTISLYREKDKYLITYGGNFDGEKIDEFHLKFVENVIRGKERGWVAEKITGPESDKKFKELKKLIEIQKTLPRQLRSKYIELLSQI